MTYEEYAKIAKALSEPKRVKILDLLSCGEMCACEILKHFDFTQPTLSHHIKVLMGADLVMTEKRGTWHHYSINEVTSQEYIKETMNLLTHETDCVCKTESKKETATGQSSVVLN